MAIQEQEAAKLLLESLDLAKDSLEILSITQTIEDLRKEIRARNMTCDAEQFLLPLFRPLYKQIPEFRERVLRGLELTGVSSEMIDLYFTRSGDQPGFVFNYKHKAGEILGPETLHTFLTASRECVFSSLKEVLNT